LVLWDLELGKIGHLDDPLTMRDEWLVATETLAQNQLNIIASRTLMYVQSITYS